MLRTNLSQPVTLTGERSVISAACKNFHTLTNPISMLHARKRC